MSKAPWMTLSSPLYDGWEKLSALEKVQRMMEAHTSVGEGEERFYDALYYPTSASQPLEILSATQPTPTTAIVIFSFTIPALYTNPLSNLHGAAAGLIYDNCTSLALAPIAKPGFWMLGGVSRVLDVKYLRAVPVGEKVTVECEVLHAGRNSAALRGVIRDAKGRVCNTCEHDKTNVDPPVARL